MHIGQMFHFPGGQGTRHVAI
jgi:hypothetical protein